jgi:hypothetical protein
MEHSLKVDCSILHAVGLLPAVRIFEYKVTANE